MSADLCKYKYSLGIPEKGIHKHYFGFALMDLLGTTIIAFLIMLVIKRNNKIKMSHSMLYSIILLILVSIGDVLHDIFCIYD